MTVRGVLAPVYAIKCDTDGCTAELREQSWLGEWNISQIAERAGWQIRPARGKGSRSAPDLCPEHRTEPAGGA